MKKMIKKFFKKLMENYTKSNIGMFMPTGMLPANFR